MADTVLTELNIHVFDTDEQMSQHESEIGDNDLVFNLDDEVDYVVESQLPTADNGYTWYRKYKSGWVEQGGMSNVDGDNNEHVFTFAIEMQDTRYMAQIQRYTNVVGGGSNATVGDFTITNTTKTSLSIPRGYNGPVRWQVSGMSAQ